MYLLSSGLKGLKCALSRVALYSKLPAFAGFGRARDPNIVTHRLLRILFAISLPSYNRGGFSGCSTVDSHFVTLFGGHIRHWEDYGGNLQKKKFTELNSPPRLLSVSPIEGVM